MSDTATGVSTTVKPLDPLLDAEAARILARCPALGSVEASADMIAAARAEENASLFGLLIDGRIAGAYVMRKVQLSNEISFLAVAREHERQGHARMCLYDALLRSGKRPLVVEADDGNVGFFKTCGFKLVGKRKAPDGSPRYRLGWHAPIPKPGGAPGEIVC